MKRLIVIVAWENPSSESPHYATVKPQPEKNADFMLILNNNFVKSIQKLSN